MQALLITTRSFLTTRAIWSGYTVLVACCRIYLSVNPPSVVPLIICACVIFRRTSNRACRGCCLLCFCGSCRKATRQTNASATQMEFSSLFSDACFLGEEKNKSTLLYKRAAQFVLPCSSFAVLLPGPAGVVTET